jgi:hypothetical protein
MGRGRFAALGTTPHGLLTMTCVRISRVILLVPLAIVLALSMLACGGSGHAGSTGAEQPQPDGATTVEPSTPIPTQSGPPLIRTTLEGSCRITATGAEIRVQYSVTAFGSTLLTRVKLLQDGKQVDDSGELEQRSYQHISNFDGEPGDQHTYRVMAESQSGSAPSAQTTVRCGTEPTTRPGPRA